MQATRADAGQGEQGLDPTSEAEGLCRAPSMPARHGDGRAGMTPKIAAVPSNHSALPNHGPRCKPGAIPAKPWGTRGEQPCRPQGCGWPWPRQGLSRTAGPQACPVPPLCQPMASAPCCLLQHCANLLLSYSCLIFALPALLTPWVQLGGVGRFGFFPRHEGHGALLGSIFSNILLKLFP